MPLESPIAVVPLLSRGLWLGAEAQLVAEILGASPVRRLAGAHRAVAGVIAWRGRAVSLVDVARLLLPGPAQVAVGHGALLPYGAALGEKQGERQSASKRLVIAQEGPFLLAIAADAVREVQAVDPKTLSPCDKDAESYSIAPRRATLGDTSILLLDLAAIGRALTAFAEPAPLSSSRATEPPPGRNGAFGWPP